LERQALDREAGLVVVRELQALEREIRHLRDGMQRLLDQDLATSTSEQRLPEPYA